ncbi:MAG: hypothetical protein KC486_23255 [Myxococcales bacterium]|nr:hypothetical protein [Myxococcales bacterium]
MAWAHIWLRVALAGLTCGCLGACLVDLEHRVACGDGYADAVAGEECDPGDLNSYKNACQSRGFTAGLAHCNPETCKIEVSDEICAYCGDGVISPGEQCDSANLGNQRCLSGDNLLTCDPLTCMLNYDACPKCGDGDFVPDIGEECDWNYDPGDDVEAEVIACEDLEPLGSIQYKGYSSGEVNFSACTTRCQLARDNCSFCGDGVVDDAYSDLGPMGINVLQGAEVCDGADADQDVLDKHCKQLCLDDGLSELKVRCEFTCEGCTTLKSPPREEANCCVRGGSSCDPGLPCCFAADNPGEVGCVSVAIDTPDGTVFLDRCRSI